MWKLMPTWIVVAALGTTGFGEEMPRSPEFSGGLCLAIGDVDDELSKRCQGERWVIQMLQPDRVAVAAARQRADVWTKRGAHFSVSLWSGKRLPYVDNLANLILCDRPAGVFEAEMLRVLRPGGLAIIGRAGEYKPIRKPEPSDTDEWRHPWHGPDGGLVTDDQAVGVPTGIQWVHGPLYAMAGRKTSTQSLIAAGGRIFAITQNVVENIGREEMAQYLVARDAYNGLLLWQRPWLGPFTVGNGELNPRIAASADHVYVGWFDGVEVFDAASGTRIDRIETPEPVTKLIVHDRRLLVQCNSGLRCYVVGDETPSAVWEFPAKQLDGTVVDGERVYAMLLKRGPEGERVGELVCLGFDKGAVLWRVDTRTWAEAGRLRICFADDGYLALIAHGALHLLRGETGKELWSQASDARPGKSYADERYVGHFYRHGLVWMQLENSPREPDGQATWAAFDPESSEERRRFRTTGLWPRTAAPAKMGCQLMLASDRHIMIPRQATFVDFATGRKQSFKFLRGGCGSGFVPANGLIYSSPHACGCYTEAVRGFLAAHSLQLPEASSGKRLVRYQDRGAAGNEDHAVTREDWPMYRHGPARTAASTTDVPQHLEPRWTASVGRCLKSPVDAAWRLRAGMAVTAPVVAGGTVYIGDVQGHRIVAIDDSRGEMNWQFTADARVDSPPTIDGGRCLFGCHDGNVYCLDAANGKLLWAYRVAPIERRIVAFGQVESAWPVAGTVLVQDGIAYAAAGRAPDADGGVTVIALDARSGKEIWTKSADQEMVGMCDYLVSGSDGVFLSDRRFDPRTGKCRTAPDDSPHLRGGKAGLLEASWFDADLALRKSIHTWTARGAAGQLLAMDGSCVFGYRLNEDGEASLFCEGENEWSVEIAAPTQIRALAVAGSTVLSAGAKARYDASQGGLLALRKADDGATLAEIDLPAPPVFDGLAVARGRVYVSLADGQVVSLGDE